MQRVRKWSWESSWAVYALFAMVLGPMLIAWYSVPGLASVFAANPSPALFTVLVGLVYGVGTLSFGFVMRYLGLSLGYSLALGFASVFGTVYPPLFRGDIITLVDNTPGLVNTGGIALSLCGIAILGWAGRSKEKSLPEAERKKILAEYNFKKGLFFALMVGVASGSVTFAMELARPVADSALKAGATPLATNNPVLALIMLGSAITNLAYCFWLNAKRKSFGEYTGKTGTPVLRNYLLAGLGGIVWYLQYMFFGMGKTQMGPRDISGWAILVSSMIVFSNVWGLLQKEWKGAKPKSIALLATGLLVLLGSVALSAYGNSLAQ
jgi:L-rhamnose-H+ transport protein